MDNKKKSMYEQKMYNGQAYIYGSAMRKTQPDFVPEQEILQPKKKASVQVRKNRRNAMRMNMGYVIFLGISVIFLLWLCIGYVRINSELSRHARNVSYLEHQIAEKKEENTTRYNNAVNSIDMNEIRRSAIEDLGMVPVKDDQIIRYKEDTESYVKQYNNIPKNGVIAQ